jgi:hypothetical protein
MRLGIGSPAAPDAGLGELLERAQRRGLEVVELEEGHGHGLDPNHAGTAAAADASERAAQAGIGIAGFRLTAPLPEPRGEEAGAVMAFARALGAPLLIPLEPDRRLVAGVDLARAVRDGGQEALPVLPAVGAMACLDHLDRMDPGIPLAWDVHPDSTDLPATAAVLLRRCGPRLRHIRLAGAGPEAVKHEGRGIGSLMARLALAGFGGTVALVPSSRRYRVIWDAWLGRGGGWGCGSAKEDRSLVTLAGAG